jgi:hypothetical protein
MYWVHPDAGTQYMYWVHPDAGTQYMYFCEDDDSDAWYHSAKLEALDRIRETDISPNDTLIMADEELELHRGKIHPSPITISNLYITLSVLKRVVQYLAPYTKAGVMGLCKGVEEDLYWTIRGSRQGQKKPDGLIRQDHRFQCLDNIRKLLYQYVQASD